MIAFTTMFLAALAFVSSMLSFSNAHQPHPAWNSSLIRACEALKARSPALLVSSPGEEQYDQDISRATPFGVRNATCSVEPRSVSEIQHILRILTETKSPFAIKSGGHANNPTHSSTEGVQISLAQFKQFQYNSSTETLTLGPALTWDVVYVLLEPLGRMVVGGRIPGVGVGGFLLGGGFSYKTNQYGLGSDTVVQYELVTPKGEHLFVNAESHPELFWGLKGGLNNFGIVISFTLATHRQTAVYAGMISVPGDSLGFKEAVRKFDVEVGDPKASMMGIYVYAGNQLGAMATLFYDAPTAPPGIFDDFLTLENLTGGMQTMTFLEFIKGAPSLPSGLRALSHSVPIRRYSKEIVDYIQRLTEDRAAALQNMSSCLFLATSMEVFQSASFAKDTPGGSAFPHSDQHAWTPFNIAAAWSDPADDQLIIDALASFASELERDAEIQGLASSNSPVYPNYALESVSLERIYGMDNLVRMADLRARLDPDDLMSQSGGFIVPFSRSLSGSEIKSGGAQVPEEGRPAQELDTLQNQGDWSSQRTIETSLASSNLNASCTYTDP